MKGEMNKASTAGDHHAGRNKADLLSRKAPQKGIEQVG